jgi:hypothetical protein
MKKKIAALSALTLVAILAVAPFANAARGAKDDARECQKRHGVVVCK